jgi:hypothetical protein
MTGWLLRLLLLLLILRALWRLIEGIVQGARAPAAPQAAGAGVPLVRDPECGNYIVPGRALSHGRGADAKYFCSERCLHTYRARAVDPNP